MRSKLSGVKCAWLILLTILIPAVSLAAPAVSTLSIKAGAAYTISRTVTLNNACSGAPAQYLASESSAFTGAVWKTWSAAPSYTITGLGDGVKRIYFKVRDAGGAVSNTLSDTIQLIVQAPVVNTFTLNNAAATATSRLVTLNNTCTGTPTHFMASQSSSFAGVVWLAYSKTPGFTLSAGNGAKTVYFKVKDAAGRVSAVKSDAITLNESPVVSSFGINNNALLTNSRTVTLNNACTGSPTYYMVSESSVFAGAVWKTWAAAPAYRIAGVGNGTKRLYFKVKNSAGVVSPAKVDTITLDEINYTLTPNGATLTGSISPAGDSDLYKLTIASAGVYVIETWPGTLLDNYMRLYGPNTMTTVIAQDNDSGTGAAAKITRALSAGTWYVRVQAYSAAAIGNYTIKVTAAPAPVVSSLSINKGAAEAWSRTVTLNNVCTGYPAYYMASERSDFSGASWKTWSAAPSYAITSAGNFEKTIYFKVKDSAGRSSSVKSDKIVLKEIFEILIDDGEYTGVISNPIGSVTDYDLYEFEVTTPGWYSIMTYSNGALNAGHITDGQMYLYDPNGDPIRMGDQQGSYGMPMISVNLPAGLYTIWFEGYDSTQVGDYAIALQSGSAYKSLAVNGAWATGNIAWDYDVNWFKFTVPAKGVYTIETAEGTLKDTVMYLYTPQADVSLPDVQLTLNDDADPGEFVLTPMPLISTVLLPGTYYVAVENFNAADHGTFTIRVRSGNRNVTFMSLIDDWASIASSIVDATEGDFYTFYVPSLDTYTITSYSGDLIKGQMILYELGAPTAQHPKPLYFLAEDYDADASAYMPEITRSLAAGYYYVWFSGYTQNDLGSYAIELTRASPAGPKPAARISRTARAPKR